MKNRVASFFICLGIILSNYSAMPVMAADIAETEKTAEKTDASSLEYTSEKYCNVTWRNCDFYESRYGIFQYYRYFGQSIHDFNAVEDSGNLKYYTLKIATPDESLPDEVLSMVKPVILDQDGNVITNGVYGEPNTDSTFKIKLRAADNTDNEYVIYNGVKYDFSDQEKAELKIQKADLDPALEYVCEEGEDLCNYYVKIKDSDKSKYQIASSLDGSFGEKIKARFNENGKLVVYVKSISGDKKDAISKNEYTHDIELQLDKEVTVLASGDSDALLDEEYFKNYAYNNDIYIKVRAYAKVNPEDVKLKIKNGETELEPYRIIEKEKYTAKDGQKMNRFVAIYKIALPENSNIEVKLNGEIKVGNKKDSGSLKMKNGKFETYSFLLDNIPPRVESAVKENNGIRFNISDGDGDSNSKNSGITLIEYMAFEKENKPAEYEFENSVTCANEQTHQLYVDFSTLLPNTVADAEAILRITDRAGNYVIAEKDENGNYFSMPIDTIPPEISEITLTDLETGTLINGNIKAYDDANYYNHPIRIKFKVEDPDPENGGKKGSGIKSVYVRYNTTVYACKPVKVIEGEAEELPVGYYYYDFKPQNTPYKNISIGAKDSAMTTEYKLTDIDAFKAVGNVKSNDLVIDAEPPKAVLTYFTGTPDSDTGVNWYGAYEQDESLRLVVSDNVKINDIKIMDHFEKDGRKITNDITNNRDVKLVTNADNKREFIIPLSIFEDGAHKLYIRANDFSGNELTAITLENADSPVSKELSDSNYYQFNIDFTTPDGRIKFDYTTQPKIVEDRESKEEQYWFDAEQAVKFLFEINDDNPDHVVYTIRSRNGSYSITDTVKYADGEIVKKITENVNKAQLEGGEHYLSVRATFFDKAGNQSDEKKIRIYKDIYDPQITKVTVSKIDNDNQSLHLLPYSIYSNNGIMVVVDASDAEYDSGLKNSEVYISYDGKDADETKFYQMKYDTEKNNYYYIIPENDPYADQVNENNIYSGKIKIIARDNVGKQTDDFEEIVSEDGSTLSKDFMIERIKPTASFELSGSDGAARHDGQIWYREDHDIKLTVHENESGLSSIKVIVNGDTEHPLETDSYGKEFLTSGMTSAGSMAVTGNIEYTLNTGELAKKHYSPDGVYRIEVIAQDNAGMVNDPCVADYHIDRDAPFVKSISFSTPSVDGLQEASEFVDNVNYGYFFSTGVTAIVNVDDVQPSSGMRSVEYKLVSYENGVQTAETAGYAEVSNNQASFEIPANFKGQIYVKCSDNVGNESTEVTPEALVIETQDRHDSDAHIFVAGLPSTSYHDNDGHPLYDKDVTTSVTISDRVSGIRRVSYSLSSEKESLEPKTIEIGNSGYSIGQQLGDGWYVSAMDENLVTEVKNDITYSSDNNNVKYSFRMFDRANNYSDFETVPFSIDKNQPVIDVTFDTPAGVDDYFSGARTATVTIRERNYSRSLIHLSTPHTYGSDPIVSYSDVSDTEHVIKVLFNNGDYQFSVDGTDLCGHQAKVNYSGSFPREFSVDTEPPKIENNFTKVTNNTKNIFNKDKEVTFTVEEHNFDPDLVEVQIYRSPLGTELDRATADDCTDEYYDKSQWKTTGTDKHTLSINFPKEKEYNYQVGIRMTDKSGQKSEIQYSPVFTIDKSGPVLKSPVEKKAIVYTKKSTETHAEPIVFEDANIRNVKYTVTSYRMLRNSDKVGYDVETETKSFETEGGTVKLDDDYFLNDGIYEVKCVAYDAIGNESDTTKHTYVVQRDTDFLVYIPDSVKAKETGLYKFNQKGIRSADFDNIKIVAYVTSDKDFRIEVDGKTVPEKDIQVLTSDSDINQVRKYDITLNRSFIANNYNDENIDTDLTLNAVASSDEGESVITLGHIYIDNVKPVGEYEAKLQEMGGFKGFYGEKTHKVTIEGVSPDIDLKKSYIKLNDKEIRYGTQGFTYNEDNHTITFTLEEGYTDIRATLVDKAGNINNLPIKKNVYVGNLFKRWWYLFVLGAAAIIGFPTFIITSRKKRRR